MVNSVSSVPYSYLGQLQGTGGAAAPAPAAPAASSSSAPSVSNSLNSVLGAGGLSSSILSLLQGGGQGSFNSTATLLGGATNSDPITGIYANLFANSSFATLQGIVNQATQQNAAAQAATNPPVQDLISAFSAASKAYNATLQSSAQAVIKANSYQADGVTPLVA